MPKLQNCSNNAGTAKNTPKLRFLAKMVEKFESSRCNISTVKKCNKAQSLKFQHFTFYYIKFRAEISRQNSTKIVKKGRNGGISPATLGWRRHGQSASKSGRRHGHLKSNTAAGGGMASPRASCQRCSTAAAGGTVKAAALPSTGG